ncbi:hypothetical protein [Pleurocapsa sp. PCC 7319]|uniref:hypothetical protein n=1 Tax=Pleurocapsa sp. PCC 7319 TaxID=118161 RepID=UPI00035E6450|nr:hypothetical protein [Pleurocapsa sp. PCC 7319]
MNKVSGIELIVNREKALNKLISNVKNNLDPDILSNFSEQDIEQLTEKIQSFQTFRSNLNRVLNELE